MINLQPLWTSEEVEKLTMGNSCHRWTATGVSIDSRTIEVGDLFIPISGPNFNGHNFIEDALKKGAAASIYSDYAHENMKGAALLKVADTGRALDDIGKGGRDRSLATVVAVTGSVGKTGVKEALGKLLSEQGKSSYNVGSYNNHFGVPLSLARLPKNADYAVFELGMNHAGELTGLSQIVRPNVAIVTTVELAHIEFFSSINDIARAKAEIFQGLQKGGTAILNKDNKFFSLLKLAALDAGAENIVGFGRDKEAQFRLIDCELNPNGSEVQVCFDNINLSYQLSMPGQHWVQNSLAVLAAVQAVGADVIAAAEAFIKIKSCEGRGQRHVLPINDGFFELIDDSYNASPVSVAAAIKVLSRLETGCSGRRICVLGDMKELGVKSTDLHSAVGDQLREAGVNAVFTVGPEMKGMCRDLPPEINITNVNKTEDLIPPLLNLVRPDDAIYQMGKIVRALSDLKTGSNTNSNDEEELNVI